MSKFRIEEMSWEQVTEVLKRTDLAILPIGATEEHGFHLPLKVDTCCVTYVAEKTALELYKKYQILVAIAPPVPYGETILTDFAGTITISAETLINLTREICAGLISHGFRKIVLLNGHYGNLASLIIAGRKIIYEYPDCRLVVVNWWSLASEIIPEIRKSEMGGMFHACEMETSVLMNIDPQSVNMKKAVKDIFEVPISSKFFTPDMYASQMATWILSKKTVPKSGVMGDPTKANKEKGEKILSSAISNLTKLIMEMVKGT